MGITENSNEKGLPGKPAKGSAKKPVFEIATSPQIDLFGETIEDAPLSLPTKQTRKFLDPNPRHLYFHGRRLDEFLKEAGLTDALLVRGVLRALDFSEFHAAYAGEGRPPYAPEAMIGLYLWGLIKQVNSLRGLERLARADLECMWVCGGIAPEFSVIGRFIRRHADLLTEDFFVQLTQKAIKASGSICNNDELAGDGTIIQAVASRYRKWTKEAAVSAAEDAARRADEAPDNQGLQQEKESAQAIADEITRRAQRRKAHGDAPENTIISPTEPDAYIQQLKRRGAAAPSYKPSVLANADRFIVGQDVHPSSETAIMESMLEQAEKTTQKPTRRLSLDSGYLGEEILNLAIERDIDVLIPVAKRRRNSSVKFGKERFVFDFDKDHYECPGGQYLKPVERYKGNESNLSYVRYGGADCDSCPFKKACTDAKRGRSIKRFESDEAREVLLEVMKDPRARANYQKRQAWVEPVFGELRDIQGLYRFRRKGLKNVRLEFSLHAMAHNIRRMIKVMGGQKTALLTALSVFFCVFWLSKSCFSSRQPVFPGFPSNSVVTPKYNVFFCR